MTPHLARVAVLIAVLIGGARAAHAEGLVQIALRGALADKGGAHLVEMEVTHADGELFLHLHLASGTTGGELAELFAQRLEASGADVTLALRGEGDRGSVWVDGVSKVALRLGGGLMAEVSCAEGPPAVVRCHVPSAIPGPMIVHVVASAAIPRSDRPPLRRRATLDVEVEADASADEVATALWKAAETKWMTERIGGTGWSPVKLLDGSVLTGVSVQLDTQADWRVEVEL